jgi:hypothetical protein
MRPNVSLVSFLNDAEGDVGEQRGEHPTLGYSGIAAHEVAFAHDASLKECDDQPIDLRVGDPSAYSVHQTMMVDVIEASLDVSLDDPLIRQPWLPTVLLRLGAQEHPQML